jgi:environmental stress-induced protein Ves
MSREPCKAVAPAQLQHFALPQVPAQPWKNGGGQTRELVCQPAGASLQDFDWRISVATIAASGPFSSYPGVDRSITLLAGDGVLL